MKDNRSIDFSKGAILKPFLAFLIPVVVGSLLQQAYSMVDAVIVGRFIGKTALASIGGSDMNIINMALVFFGGLSIGSTVIVSQSVGANDEKKLSEAVVLAISFSIVFGAILTIFMSLLGSHILQLMNTPEETMKDSLDYLIWYFYGMIPTLVYNMGSGILRARGDSRRPLYYLIIGTIANIILDVLFVIVLKAGIKGAAAATVISQIICMVLVLITLKREYGLRLKGFKLDKALLFDMLKIGLPTGLQNALYLFTGLFIQRAINLLGTDSVASWSAFWKIDGFFWAVSSSFNIATVAFSGQCYGYKDYKRIKRGTWIILASYIVFSLCFSSLLLIFKTPLVSLFISDEAIIEEGARVISYIVMYYALFSFTEIYAASIRGTGNTFVPTLITLLSICLLRILLLYGWAYKHLSSSNIAIIYPITWATSSILFIVYYHSGKWLRIKEK